MRLVCDHCARLFEIKEESHASIGWCKECSAKDRELLYSSFKQAHRDVYWYAFETNGYFIVRIEQNIKVLKSIPKRSVLKIQRFKCYPIRSKRVRS